MQLSIATDPPDRALPLLVPARRSLTPEHLPLLDEPRLNESGRSLDLSQPDPLLQGCQTAHRLNPVSQSSQSGQGAITRAFWLTKLAAQMIQTQQTQSGFALLAEALQMIRSTHSLANPVPGLLTTIATQYVAAKQPDQAVPLLDRVLRIVQTAEITPFLPPSRLSVRSRAMLPSRFSESAPIAQILALATLAEHYGAAGNFIKAIALACSFPAQYGEWCVELLMHLSHHALATQQLDAAILLLEQARQAVLTLPITPAICRQKQVRWLIMIAACYTHLANPIAATCVLDDAIAALGSSSYSGEVQVNGTEITALN